MDSAEGEETTLLHPVLTSGFNIAWLSEEKSKERDEFMSL
jgi:hypothetical protein